MSNAAIELDRLVTLDEYLALEEKAQLRHEYHAGRIYAMSGGSPVHAQLGFNTITALGRQLIGKRCRGATGDQRIRIEATDELLYPDAIVVCPPERYSEKDQHALINPSLVVEVLSPSTEKYDRSNKFLSYEQIPEMKDYLMVSQDKVLVEHYRRTDDGGWLLYRFNNRDDVIRLTNIDIEVSVAEIYDRIDVPSGLIILDQTLERNPVEPPAAN